MAERRVRRTYSEEQKKHLVELFNHGKPRSEIVREYDLTGSAFDKWENGSTRPAPATTRTTGRRRSMNFCGSGKRISICGWRTTY